MKIVIKEKVIPYILISLFSFIGLSAYGYKAEGQGGSKAVVWSISKIDTMQKNVQRNDERNPNIQNIEYLKKMFRQKAVDEKAQAADLFEIRHPAAGRGAAAGAHRQRRGHGRPVFLQVYLPAGRT